MPGIGLPVVMSSTICANEVGYAGSEVAEDSAVATVVPVEGSLDCSDAVVAAFDFDEASVNQAL